ncbi:hypothetical protein HEAR0401 [Herminiimonas arsenicoxydans]|uniref:Uncharacterized protein n=1 Tax=Herminiimonas arsenicoxydans TaxID=204773 RepID=A4G285_HERAR|nr:hypothetical protein HEAR0401 [Herminiimonas arsenicoxydans]
MRSAPARRHPKGCVGRTPAAAFSGSPLNVFMGEPTRHEALGRKRPKARCCSSGVLAPRPRQRSGKRVRQVQSSRDYVAMGGALKAHAEGVCPSAAKGPQDSPTLVGQWGPAVQADKPPRCPQAGIYPARSVFSQNTRRTPR